MPITPMEGKKIIANVVGDALGDPAPEVSAMSYRLADGGVLAISAADWRNNSANAETFAEFVRSQIGAASAKTEEGEDQ